MTRTKVAQGQVSGAQRMRARDAGRSSGTATPVAPAATDVAAAGVAAGAQTNPAATSLGAAGMRPNPQQAGATAAGYMAASGGGRTPPGSVMFGTRSTGQQPVATPAAAPAPQPFQYNPQAQRLETVETPDGGYEAWTGPHNYQGQAVDMKYILNYADGSASWKPSGELRVHQGG